MELSLISLRRVAGRLIPLAALLLSLAAPTAALAHGDEAHMENNGPHGGLMRGVGLFHVELRVGNGEARVWLTDHAGTPQPTQGRQGSLLVMTDAGGYRIRLQPSGKFELAGRDTRIRPEPGLRLQFELGMADGRRVQTRFVLPGRVEADSHAGHRH